MTQEMQITLDTVARLTTLWGFEALVKGTIYAICFYIAARAARL